jgi:hypothetical protein
MIAEQKCDRCHKPTLSTIMSKFNEEAICTDCKLREAAHPKYKEACEAEEAAIRAGNYNYPGIGCPPDLYPLEALP